LKLALVSFGFKNGLPLDVDLVFDCRFMPNPYWDPELRPMNGLDESIQNYVLAPPISQEFIAQVFQMLKTLLPAYADEGRSYLTVAFGCTGGKHRSVAVAEKVGEVLEKEGWPSRIRHRDISK
jgi:UPF0042 nucleotide-binding protein